MTTQKQIERNASILVWFEIPADNVERAKTFYSALFGWNIQKLPGSMEYWHIDTRGGDNTPDGGLTERQHPQQGMVCYVSVPSVDEFISKVQKLGGKTFLGKTAVAQMGYFAICQDTENNTFGLWEKTPDAR